MNAPNVKLTGLSFSCNVEGSVFEVTVTAEGLGDGVRVRCCEGHAPAQICTPKSGGAEPVQLFGTKARASLQFYALLAAVAIRARDGGLTIAELREATGWADYADDASIAARIRALLGHRVRQSESRWVFADPVVTEFKPDVRTLAQWVWPPRPSSSLDLVQSAAVLFRSGEKVDRKKADELARQWGRERKLPLQWLVDELRSRERSREERAVIARAIGVHPDADDAAVVALLAQLGPVRGEGSVYAYRMLHSVRELLTAGKVAHAPERYFDDLIHFEETGGSETSVAARAVRRMLLSRALQPVPIQSVRERLQAVRNALIAENVATAREILDRLLEDLSFGPGR